MYQVLKDRKKWKTIHYANWNFKPWKNGRIFPTNDDTDNNNNDDDDKMVVVMMMVNE